MTAAVRRKKRKDEIKVTISPFRSFEDYKSCEEIQREAWRSQDIDIVPAPLLVIVERSGGILLGAYNRLGEAIGFVCSIPGMMDGKLIQHSCMLAVRTAYRNFDVGFKLKMAQRKDALKHKIRSIHSAFDPMQPLQAYFNLGKLGVRANTYELNLYGETTNYSDRGLPTDRLSAHWDLDSEAVVQRMNAGPPRHDLRKEFKQHTVINQLVDVEPGMTTCSSVKLNVTAGRLLFEIPYNLPEIKNRNLGVALEWQGKMRQVFRHYFKKGYTATDFWVAEQEGHLRAFYLLEKKKR